MAIERETGILIEIKKFQNAMQGENGRIIFEHLQKLCGQDRTTFNNSALEMARNEGKREVFLLIKRELQMDVDKIIEKIHEERIIENVLD